METVFSPRRPYWCFCALLSLAATLVPVTSGAQISVTFDASFSPATIGPGSVSTLELVITNSDQVEPATELAFINNLPAGVSIAGAPQAFSTCGGILAAPAGGSTITFIEGGVGASEDCAISVDVTSSTAGTHTNTSGDLTSSAGNSGPASADLTVATDRPGFTKGFSLSPVAFGGRSTLTLTIDNTTNTAAANNLTFTDALPPGMVVASPSMASITCTGGVLTAVPGTSLISYGPATFPVDASVAAGSSCTVTVDVLGNAVGFLDNTAGELTTTDSFGQSFSSGMASARLAVTSDRLVLTKSFSDDPVAPGATVSLELTLRNLDRGYPATGVTFTDDLAATLNGLVATGLPLADPCGPGSQLSGTSLLTLTGGELGFEGICTFSVTLQVPAGAASGSYPNTTSTVTADVDGIPVVGAPATDLLVVSPVPSLTKTFIGDPVGAGGTVDLEFTVTNTSATSAATDIAFTDELTTFLPFPVVATLPSPGFCGAQSSMTLVSLGTDRQGLFVTGGELAAGASCSFTVTGLSIPIGMPAGTYTNTTGEVTATIDGETVSGSFASDDLKVVAAPSLIKELIDDPAIPGGTVTLQFTLSHDETAPADATEITFSDDLSAALAGLEAVGLPVADACGIGSEVSGTANLSLSGGTLTPGESCTFSVTLQVPTDAAPGAHTNETSAVVATVLGVTATESPASDDLLIAGLTLAKTFTDDPVLPGGTVRLEFSIHNINPTETATGIAFQDELDEVLSGLFATGLPLVDICGAGSSLTGSSGDALLSFEGGELAAGASCTFSTTLQVPADAAPDTYPNRTTGFSAVFDSSPVELENASDELVVASDFIMLSKEFVDDPVGPGNNVILRFSLTNLHDTGDATAISFTDNLEATLSGLVATGLPLNDVCGTGSQISGDGFLSFTGGTLAAGASCTFDVTLAVPAAVQLGTVATNTTSRVTGTIDGFAVTGDPARDELLIDFLSFTKSFDGPVNAGDTVKLSFNISNFSATESVADLAFSDDLNGMINGLSAVGLPVADVCGPGSSLGDGGGTFLILTGANLLPSGSCTFDVLLQVPASTSAGTYTNITSSLLQNGIPVANPATAELIVEVVTDSDGDGVLDGNDVCAGTVIPEGVPTVRLGTNRFALVDGDLVFDTNPPNGQGPGESFTTFDTGGCSCEQIIQAMGLGKGHEKFGCALGEMREWISVVSTSTSNFTPVRTIPGGPGRVRPGSSD